MSAVWKDDPIINNMLLTLLSLAFKHRCSVRDLQSVSLHFTALQRITALSSRDSSDRVSFRVLGETHSRYTAKFNTHTHTK